MVYVNTSRLRKRLSSINTDAKYDEYCYYAHKSAIVDELSINYILENLRTDYSGHMCGCYVVDSKYCTIDETIGEFEYTVKAS